jgi:arginyl-tRNA synthetase
VEFSDPNPFKLLHVGHIYTSVIGDGIANLIQTAGGTVHRVNFGGDVGLHVAKNLWAMVRELGGEHPEKLADIRPGDRGTWMAKCYVEGAQAYKTDEAAKPEIIELNRRVYQIHRENDHESALAQMYWICRSWSYDFFADFYARLGIVFEKYYPESETAPLGLTTVHEQLGKGVYQQSQGAVIFDGEPYGLHARVFITSQGLPTYEAKDVGLIEAKWRDYQFDRSVVITGNDITDYMKVVLKSVEQFAPDLVRRTTHVTHGNVKLAGGVKMSSRLGNTLGAVEALDMVSAASREASGQDNQQVALGAIKYAFLKSRIGADVIFVPQESVALDGNSGPYLQYAQARARSILRKADGAAGPASSGRVDQAELVKAAEVVKALQPAERTLARRIGEYPEILQKAVDDLMPHYICTYLYELAQAFNRFYEGNRVMGDARQQVRLTLVEQYADVLQAGLAVLGIKAPSQL